ncbi:GNAT family N-acetyltransferase [Rubrivivax rivuli]|nr:GNAT family N-acetyltransferase [Rubrivivax rivuli]
MRLNPQAAPAPAAADRPFSVRPVDAGNVDAVLKLQVAAGQRRLVSNVERSLAQVAYEPAGRAVAMFSGEGSDEEAVGMMLLYDMRMDKKSPADQLYVWRLLVDERFQGLGHGRRAMQWVIEEARRLGLPSVGLSHVELEGHAGDFYEKLGFRYTGEVDEGELKMILALGGD